jgi:hypothetical protein
MTTEPSHELYCDEQHPPRQRCNDALAPPGVRAALVGGAVAPDAASAIADPVEAEDPASSAIRDAVSESGAPQPTVYVSREWERTEAAVGGRDTSDAVPDAPSGGSSVRRIAMVAVAIAVVLLTVRGVRGRRGERM